MSEKKIRGRGRPAKLDDRLATEIAARVLVGEPTTSIASALGVSPRSIYLWRSRAWSRDPRDRFCVELEQMIMRGMTSYAKLGQRVVPTTLPGMDFLLDEAVAPFTDAFWLD
jgi:hypothetical protein